MSSSLDKNISTGFLLKFAIPTVITMVFMSIYTMVDGIFVSRLIGTDALSAVNIVMPIILTSYAIATMVGTGGNAIVAKKLGEKKHDEARKNFSSLTLVTIILSCIITIISFVFIHPLLTFLGADESIYKYAYDYAVYSLIFLPFTMFSAIFQSFFVTEGKANLSLVFTVVGGILNMIFDYVFIKVLGIGIAGAAIATGIGYTVPGLLGLLYFIFYRKGSLYLVKPNIDLKLIKDTCINGSSEMVSNLSASIITLLMNNILMSLAGPDGVASITVILYVQMLLIAIFMGYSMGTSPLISFNYGKQDHERLHKIYKKSLIIISVISISVFIFGIVKTELLISIFTGKGTEVFNMAAYGFKLFAPSFIFVGINIFSSALFTAFSNGRVSALISFLRTLLFVVIFLLVLPKFFGVNGVWIAVPLAEIFGFLVSIYYLKKYKVTYGY